MSIQDTQNVYNLIGRMNYSYNQDKIKEITEPSVYIGDLEAGLYHIINEGSVDCVYNSSFNNCLTIYQGYLFISKDEKTTDLYGSYFGFGYLLYNNPESQFYFGAGWAIGSQMGDAEGNIRYQTVLVSSNVEEIKNKVAFINDASTDTQYPSALAVKNFVDNYEANTQGKLIYSSVLTEETTTFDITRSNEGNPFALKEMYLALKIPANPNLAPMSYVGVKLRYNNITAARVRNNTIVSGGTEGNYHFIFMKANIHNKRWEYEFGTALNMFASYDGAHPDRMGYIINNNDFTYNELKCTTISVESTGVANSETGEITYTNIPAGTIIELYGK